MCEAASRNAMKMCHCAIGYDMEASADTQTCDKKKSKICLNKGIVDNTKQVK